MGMPLTVSAMAEIGMGQPQLAFRPAVSTAHAQVRLADVTDLSQLPPALRARAAQLPVAVFKPGQLALHLSALRVRERLRAQLPALAPYLMSSRGEFIDLRFTGAFIHPPSTRLQAAPCVQVAQALPASAVVKAHDLQPVSCTGRLVVALHFDQGAGVVRTNRAVGAGEVIAAPPTGLMKDVAFGDRLWLRVKIGRVTVEREVQALQAGRFGQRLFVRGNDGQAFAATPEQGSN